jgi:hypothetical protein
MTTTDKDKQAALEALDRSNNWSEWVCDYEQTIRAALASKLPERHPDWEEFEVWLENNAGDVKQECKLSEDDMKAILDALDKPPQTKENLRKLLNKPNQDELKAAIQRKHLQCRILRVQMDADTKLIIAAAESHAKRVKMKITITGTKEEDGLGFSVIIPSDDVGIVEVLRATRSLLLAWGFQRETIDRYMEIE